MPQGTCGRSKTAASSILAAGGDKLTRPVPLVPPARTCGEPRWMLARQAAA
ncbi:MAG TPA: hypothetical protein VFB96_19170 [Pirellulaceae bacterium]|nr:hypothetical protein [Pirellulaceae bacterium]